MQLALKISANQVSKVCDYSSKSFMVFRNDNRKTRITYSRPMCQTPSKRQTDKHALQQRPLRSPPSRRVDVAATRDRQTDGRTDAANYIREVCPSVRPSVS